MELAIGLGLIGILGYTIWHDATVPEMPEIVERKRLCDYYATGGVYEEVKDVIWGLGMMNVRYIRLKRMTQDYLTWDRKDATMLYGIGQYGSESYRIFFNNERFEPKDKELRKYLGY